MNFIFFSTGRIVKVKEIIDEAISILIIKEHQNYYKKDIISFIARLTK